MAKHEVTRAGLELPKGARLTTPESDAKAGDLCKFQVGTHLILGRGIPGWIIQPGRWIRITGDVVVKLLGVAMLFVA